MKILELEVDLNDLMPGDLVVKACLDTLKLTTSANSKEEVWISYNMIIVSKTQNDFSASKKHHRYIYVVCHMYSDIPKPKLNRTLLYVGKYKVIRIS